MYQEINDSHQSYVTFEQALTLKELGFNWTVDFYYSQEGAPVGHVWFHPLQSRMDYNNLPEYANLKRASAPTLSQAAKWLRDVKGIFIDVFLNASGYGWELCKTIPIFATNGTRIKKFDYQGEHEDSGMWLSYEQALTAGIDKVLEILNAKNDEQR